MGQMIEETSTLYDNVRFHVGAGQYDYIDVMLSYDYEEGEAVLDVRGGSASGIIVKPLSGNHVAIKVKGK